MPFINSVRGSFGAQGKFTGGALKVLLSGTPVTPTISGGYTIYTLTGNNTGANLTKSYTIEGSKLVNYLVVGGGGGGGSCVAGGGGAGGYLSGTVLVSPSSTVSVGGYGERGSLGTQDRNSKRL